MKSEEDKDGPPTKLAKRPILIATTTDLPELARLGAQLATAAARVSCCVYYYQHHFLL